MTLGTLARPRRRAARELSSALAPVAAPAHATALTCREECPTGPAWGATGRGAARRRFVDRTAKQVAVPQRRGGPSRRPLEKLRSRVLKEAGRQRAVVLGTVPGPAPALRQGGGLTRARQGMAWHGMCTRECTGAGAPQSHSLRRSPFAFPAGRAGRLRLLLPAVHALVGQCCRWPMRHCCGGRRQTRTAVALGRPEAAVAPARPGRALQHRPRGLFCPPLSWLCATRLLPRSAWHLLAVSVLIVALVPPLLLLCAPSRRTLRGWSQRSGLRWTPGSKSLGWPRLAPQSRPAEAGRARQTRLAGRGPRPVAPAPAPAVGLEAPRP